MTDVQELEAVKKIIMDHYHEGHAKHDYKYYEEALHKEWKFFLLDKEGKLVIVDKELYYSWYDPKDRDENLNWETEIYYVDITGNVGSAKIRLECEKVQFIDYFNLLKIEGKWWIVHKISHANRKE
jgi:hypothetical protein